MPKVRAPAGFNLVVKPIYFKGRLDEVRVQLLTSVDKTCIGEIELMRWESNNRHYLETHSNLDTRYHNKGLGVLLYAKAIEWAFDNGYKIRSSGCGSKKSQAVWRGRTIRKYFNIITRHYKCPNNSEFNLNPDWDTFFALPKS